MIDASLNEVESVAAKAARGGGLSWGLAEDTGKAARWLAAHGLPWSASLLEILRDWPYSGRPDFAGDKLAAEDAAKPLSPLNCGAFLADIANLRPLIQIENVASAMWLLPFIARTATACGSTALVEWRTVAAAVTADACLANGTQDVLAASEPALVMVRHVPSFAAMASYSALPIEGRSHVPWPHWRALDEIGARTYVPGSAESRAKGAGAGLVDND